MSADVVVLGAGMVGVSVAAHLQRRGRNVVLLDRGEPGRETSYGNAGIIQKEGIRPHTFPRSVADLLAVAGNRGVKARYDWRALPGYAGPLLRYWVSSAPSNYDRIVGDYAPLIAHSVSEHADLIAAAGADDLIRRDGWYLLFRTAAERDDTFHKAETVYADYGVKSARLDAAGVRALEPHLTADYVGALHWQEPWTARDPGALVAAYARYFESLGGTIVRGDATTLRPQGAGWTLRSADGPVSAGEVVVALGPWAPAVIGPLGYRLPLFIKRGYHMHYRAGDGTLNNWVYDEAGFLLAPMRAGIRLTTGAEFAAQDKPPTPAQLDAAEAIARKALPLGERVDPQPWLGARPCTPDMKPVIGRAPRHANLWFAFGHAHHGFTLGAVTGRLLAEAMTGEKPFLDLGPFGAERFL